MWSKVKVLSMWQIPVVNIVQTVLTRRTDNDTHKKKEKRCIKNTTILSPNCQHKLDPMTNHNCSSWNHNASSPSGNKELDVRWDLFSRLYVSCKALCILSSTKSVLWQFVLLLKSGLVGYWLLFCRSEIKHLQLSSLDWKQTSVQCYSTRVQRWRHSKHWTGFRLRQAL